MSMVDIKINSTKGMYKVHKVIYQLIIDPLNFLALVRLSSSRWSCGHVTESGHCQHQRGEFEHEQKRVKKSGFKIFAQTPT